MIIFIRTDTDTENNTSKPKLYQQKSMPDTSS